MRAKKKKILLILKMKKPPKEMKGDSLLFKSAILTLLVFLALIIINIQGIISPMSFWFFSAPIYFFFISFLYGAFIDKPLTKARSFIAIYPILIIAKLIFTASFIILYTELSSNPQLSFWVLVVVLYFLYSSLIAISLYRNN